MLRTLAPYLGYTYVTIVGWTTRQRVLRAEVPRAIHEKGERFIYAFWHQRQIFFTWSHRNVDAAVLVSDSNDGEMISRTMELSGMPIVPIANALSRKLEIVKAWDRLQVPLPFGRSVVIYGDPVRVSAGDDLAAKAAELKAALDALTDEADRLVR